MRQTLSMASSVAIMPSNGVTTAPRAARGSALERVDVERAADDQPQHVGIDGLLVEIVGAEDTARTALSRSWLPVTTMTFVRGASSGSPERRHAFIHAFGIGRQPEILQHHRRLEAAQLRQWLRAVPPQQHLVLVEAPVQLLLQTQVVFDDQQFRLVFSSRTSPGACRPAPSQCLQQSGG